MPVQRPPTEGYGATSAALLPLHSRLPISAVTGKTRPPKKVGADFFTTPDEVLTAWLDSACDSPHTRRAYRRHVRAALDFLRVRSLSDLRGTDLAQWRAEVMAHEWGPASQSQCLAALRSFLRWSRAMGAHQLFGEVIEMALRGPRNDVRRFSAVLTDQEAAGLIRSARSPRDAALFGVMIGAGLRAAEAVGLRVDDVIADVEGGHALHVREGKGRKSRTVPIQADLAALIRRYLASTGRRLGGAGPLFRPHDRGAPKRESPEKALSTRACGHLVKSAARRAGIEAKVISPHTLRHTFAVRALRAGHDVEAVRRLLGHASIATTQRYVDHLGLGELRAAVPPLPE